MGPAIDTSRNRLLLAKMKIVRLIARLNVGGPARHVVWLTDALNNEEFETTLVTGRVPVGEDDMSYFAEEHGVKPVFIEQMSRELSPKDLISLWKVYKEILRRKPDVIHTHTAKAGTVGRLAGFCYRWIRLGTLIGQPRRVSIVHTFHGHVFHSYYGSLKTKIFLIIERVLARLVSDKILVISGQQLKEINEDFRIGKREQFKVVRLGIDLGKFENSIQKRAILRKELGIDDDTLLVGAVGRLTEIKNLEHFLDVAKTYKSNANPDHPKMRFVLIGDGNLRSELEDRARELNILDLLSFTGSRNDPDIFYSGLDVVALTSLNEGTPLSLIEGMACGKPVISTKVGGVVDLIGSVSSERDGYEICNRGIGVKSGDAEVFLRALIELASDESLRDALGEDGRAFVFEQYSKERLVRDVEQLYRSL